MTLDEDGYPTEDALTRIEVWSGTPRDLMYFVRSLWWAADWGWHQQCNEHGALVYQISTGGWSGNESLIDALKQCRWFWGFYWKASRRGGHYTFEIPAEQDQPLGQFPPLAHGQTRRITDG